MICVPLNKWIDAGNWIYECRENQRGKWMIVCNAPGWLVQRDTSKRTFLSSMSWPIDNDYIVGSESKKKKDDNI